MPICLHSERASASATSLLAVSLQILQSLRRQTSQSNKATPGPDSNTSKSIGVIRQIATQPGASLTGRQVEASEAEPRYEVCYAESIEMAVLVETNLMHPADRE